VTFYVFRFRCGRCESESRVRYMVPDVRKYTETTLSCKECEQPMLRVHYDPKWHHWHEYWEHRYKVWDVARGRWLVGSKDEAVSRDAFWGWVTDHAGQRLEE